MIIKAFILTTLLGSDPAIIAIPPTEEITLQAKRRRGKQDRHRRRGGRGLR